MQRKNIKVGETYAIYINRAFRPSGKLDFSSADTKAEHYHARGGVPTRYTYQGDMVEGTIISLDAPRHVSASRNYNRYKIKNDGILVQLATPRPVDGGKTITSIIVEAKHVQHTWVTEIANRDSQKKAEKRWQREREQARDDRFKLAQRYRTLGLEVEDPNAPVGVGDWGKTWDVDWDEYGDLSGSVKVTPHGIEKLCKMIEGYQETLDLHWSPEQATEMKQLVLARAVVLPYDEDES